MACRRRRRRLREDDVDAERRPGGGGVLLCRPLPSPRLAPDVRARWSEAAGKVVLPRCAARAESAAEAAPPAAGALGGLRTPPQVSAPRLWAVCVRVRFFFFSPFFSFFKKFFSLPGIGRRSRSGALPLGFLLLPEAPEAAAYPTCVTWNPGTRVPTRIIVARLPAGPGARCPSAAAAAPVSGGEDGQDLSREEAAPAPRSAAGSRRCRAARTRRWGEAGA